MIAVFKFSYNYMNKNKFTSNLVKENNFSQFQKHVISVFLCTVKIFLKVMIRNFCTYALVNFILFNFCSSID